MLAPRDETQSDSLGYLEALVPWIDSVRAACDTLLSMPPHLMDSIAVTGSPDGRAEELRLLRSYSIELAERHDLSAEVTLGGEGFTVRFSRGSASG